jgi:hypothetical protein
MATPIYSANDNCNSNDSIFSNMYSIVHCKNIDNTDNISQITFFIIIIICVRYNKNLLLHIFT